MVTLFLCQRHPIHSVFSLSLTLTLPLFPLSTVQGRRGGGSRIAPPCGWLAGSTPTASPTRPSPPSRSPSEMATHELQRVVVGRRHAEHQTLEPVHLVHEVGHLCTGGGREGRGGWFRVVVVVGGCRQKTKNTETRRQFLSLICFQFGPRLADNMNRV